MRRFYKAVFYAVMLMSMLAVAGAQAQTTDRVLIKGRVIDVKDKLPVIGATVIEQDKDKRTITGVATDIDGNFAIKVSNTANKLVISIIGYKPRLFDIGNRREFNVTMESNASSLNEVQITANRQTNNGTGLNVDKRDQTTSTVTLSAKDVEELQATTIDQAIQGRLPGVDIVANSGDPGAGMSIRIRGTSTINGVSNPLVVVDGVPFSTSVPSDFNFSTADNQQYADLLSIAPSDIKDISILKDAAATAVWGSRAANGVLIITTKRGAKGPPTVTYTFKGTTTQQPTGIPLLTGDQYSTFIPEMVMNVNGTPLNTQTAREFAYDVNDKYNYNNYSQNTDWIKAISRRGHVYDNNMSISGGGEKAKYFASVGYNSQRGTTVGTGFNRLNTRVNLDYTVSDRIRFTTFISYAHTSTNYNYSNDDNSNRGGGLDNVRNIAALKMPNASIYEYNEFGVLTPNYFSPLANIQGQYTLTPRTTVFNPAAMANSAVNNLVNDRITPHFNIVYNIIPDLLTATSDIVFDISNGKQVTFLPQIATGRPFTETTVNRATNSDFDTYSVATKTNFILTPNFGEKHSFSGLLSLQTEDNKSVTQYQLTTNTASSVLQDPSVPSRTLNGEIRSGLAQTRSVAALLNAQYKYLDRYIINVALRGDGSSRFGSSNRYGLFPSVSGRYRLSGEPFMKKFSGWLDELSFRGGLGMSGNPPSRDYLFYGIYANTGSNYLGQSGLYPTNIQLDNLKWETLQGIDAGLNIILFKNRLNIDFGVYRNRTKDLLYNNLGITTTSGYGTLPFFNVGVMDNQGMELSIFTTPYKSKDLTVNFNMNIANNINTVREISQYAPVQSGNVTVNGEYLRLLQVNNPIGSFYGYKFKGVYANADATIARAADGTKIISPDGTPVQMRFNYPATAYQFQAGDAMYEDINHDGNINYQDVVYLGNGNPRFTGGFGPAFTWKNSLTLQAFFNYRIGGQIVNGTKMTTTNQYSYNNQSTAVLRRWRTEGDETDMPRALYRTGFNWLGSDRYVESGTFLRLRSITARYNMTKGIARRLRAKTLSVYVTAENLLTLTKYTGQDPEVSVRDPGIFQQVIDYSTTPPLKQFTVGLSAAF